MSVFRLPVKIAAPNASASVNVWHLRSGTWDVPAIDNAALTAGVQRIRALYLAIAAYYPAGTTVTSEGPINVSSGEAPAAAFAPVTGTGTGGSLPPHLACCVSWKTSSRTRRGTGRTFFGPLVTGWLETDGTITNAVLANMRTNVASLVTDSGAANSWAIGVYGQQDAMPGAPAEARQLAPHVFRDITSSTIRDTFAVMRSRRP